MMTFTKPTKASDIKREWHAIDVNGETLGRTCVRVAALLMGKAKPYFTRNLDYGDYVVVTNAKFLRVTGKKEKDKKYYSHSGYPGGLKVKKLADLRQKDPGQIIIHAVKGMLPQNKLRDRMLKRLFVFASTEHPYEDKVKIKNEK